TEDIVVPISIPYITLLQSGHTINLLEFELKEFSWRINFDISHSSESGIVNILQGIHDLFLLDNILEKHKLFFGRLI
ncbi:MAG: hypothetical protein COW21_03380, partial [Candidatus Aenigmarchaeota archaeon CG15_BIG_FIL_POST_REV_8_21_14_020_37_27]